MEILKIRDCESLYFDFMPPALQIKTVKINYKNLRFIKKSGFDLMPPILQKKNPYSEFIKKLKSGFPFMLLRFFRKNRKNKSQISYFGIGAFDLMPPVLPGS